MLCTARHPAHVHVRTQCLLWMSDVAIAVHLRACKRRHAVVWTLFLCYRPFFGLIAARCALRARAASASHAPALSPSRARQQHVPAATMLFAYVGLQSDLSRSLEIAPCCILGDMTGQSTKLKFEHGCLSFRPFGMRRQPPHGLQVPQLLGPRGLPPPAKCMAC